MYDELFPAYISDEYVKYAHIIEFYHIYAAILIQLIPN